jgi:hypothetical protein
VAQEAAVQRSRVRELEALEIGRWSTGWIEIWRGESEEGGGGGAGGRGGLG